jgi:protease II
VASTLPPIAKKVPTKIYIGKNPLKPNEFRGNNIMDPPIERLDDYQWLRDETRKNTEVLNHLKAENNYCAQQTKHLESLKNEDHTIVFLAAANKQNEKTYKEPPSSHSYLLLLSLIRNKL